MLHLLLFRAVLRANFALGRCGCSLPARLLLTLPLAGLSLSSGRRRRPWIATFVIRMTFDQVFEPGPWDDVSAKPAQLARAWAGSQGVKPKDIIDTWGFARVGRSKVCGLMRVRDRNSAHTLCGSIPASEEEAPLGSLILLGIRRVWLGRTLESSGFLGVRLSHMVNTMCAQLPLRLWD